MNLDPGLEASLETSLGRVMAPSPDADDAAARRALARLDAAPLPPQRHPWFAAWWPDVLMNLDFAPAWPRVAALASAAVLGISLGISSFGASIATRLDLARAAPVDETGANLFDSDSLNGGLRQ